MSDLTYTIYSVDVASIDHLSHYNSNDESSMSMKTDVLSHIERQIDELRHIYENIKAECCDRHESVNAFHTKLQRCKLSQLINDISDQFVKVKGILDDLKIQFKTLLLKKGKTPLMPTVSKSELFRRNFSTPSGKKSQTTWIQLFQLVTSGELLLLHGSMWSWQSAHESSWICSIVSYNLVTHEDTHYEFEIKTKMSEELFANLLPERSYSDVRVSRRYKEFEALYDTLQRVFPYLFVPTLPPKKPKKLRVELTVKRKSRFELWLSYLASHPIFCRAPCVLNFLISEEEWRRPSKERYCVVPIENLVTFPPYTGVSSIKNPYWIYKFKELHESILLANGAVGTVQICQAKGREISAHRYNPVTWMANCTGYFRSTGEVIECEFLIRATFSLSKSSV
ncbi:hypothetical protein ACTXT7_015274 [Hymenolepis weldensis]